MLPRGKEEEAALRKRMGYSDTSIAKADSNPG